MNAVEERLVAALEARAGQVSAASLAPAALSSHRRRSVVPWLAAAAVLLVIAGIALAVRPDRGSSPEPTPTPLPTPTVTDLPELPALEPLHPAMAKEQWYDVGEVYSPNGPDTLPTVDLQEDADGSVSLFWGLSGVGRAVTLHRDVGINDRWRLLGATTAEGGFLVRWDEPFEFSSLPNYWPPQHRWVVNTPDELVVVDVPQARSFGSDRRRLSSLWLDRSGTVMTWEGIDVRSEAGTADQGTTRAVRVYRWRVEGGRAVPTELGTYCVDTAGIMVGEVRVPKPC